jgi:hypothetical protein
MPPSSLRDEYHNRVGFLEREAQTIHLLCLNYDMNRRAHGEDYETHIAEIVKRLQRVQASNRDGMIEKA